jgi:hypothetical protein
MVLELDAANAIERTAHGRNLFDHLDAVRVVFDEFQDRVEVAAGRLETVEDRVFFSAGRLLLRAILKSYPRGVGLSKAAPFYGRSQNSVRGSKIDRFERTFG